MNYQEAMMRMLENAILASDSLEIWIPSFNETFVMVLTDAHFPVMQYQKEAK